jgi:hypothetical protein
MPKGGTMLSLKQYIVEGNPLQQKVNKHLASGHSIGAVSPEGPHTDTPEKKKAAHAEMQKDLDHAHKSGHIGGWSGPHKGEYQYGGEHEVSHEGSYLVHASEKGKEGHNKMVHALKKVGNKHKQESILAVHHKSHEGSWHHLDASAKSRKVENQGKVHYNVKVKPGEEKGKGRTRLGANQTFTAYK